MLMTYYTQEIVVNVQVIQAINVKGVWDDRQRADVLLPWYWSEATT